MCWWSQIEIIVVLVFWLLCTFDQWWLRVKQCSAYCDFCPSGLVDSIHVCLQNSGPCPSRSRLFWVTKSKAWIISCKSVWGRGNIEQILNKCAFLKGNSETRSQAYLLFHSPELGLDVAGVSEVVHWDEWSTDHPVLRRNTHQHIYSGK